MSTPKPHIFHREYHRNGVSGVCFFVELRSFDMIKKEIRIMFEDRKPTPWLPLSLFGTMFREGKSLNRGRSIGKSSFSVMNVEKQTHKGLNLYVFEAIDDGEKDSDLMFAIELDDPETCFATFKWMDVIVWHNLHQAWRGDRYRGAVRDALKTPTEVAV